MNNKKRVLVTGGAGFVGSWLCRFLLEQGHDVICLDNFFTGSKQNVLPLMQSPFFELVRHDITMPYFAEVDEIYNLACPSSPVHYQYNPIKTVKTSVLGAINTLGLAKRVRAKILLASTSEVYGDPQVHPQPESYWGWVNPLGPRACYDEGKRCAETLFMSYRHQNGVDTKIARIFNTFGPNMRPEDGRVISNFIAQALKGEDISIFGDGNQTRSFCFVSDLIRGLVRLMQTSAETMGPINLGNPREITVLELAEIILKMTGSHSKIKHFPLPKDDPKRRNPNIDLAKKMLDWQPTVSLEEGLEQTIAYFRKLLK